MRESLQRIKNFFFFVTEIKQCIGIWIRKSSKQHNYFDAAISQSETAGENLYENEKSKESEEQNTAVFF